MGPISAIASTLLLLLAAVPAVLAVTFKVGDASGWNIGVDYTTWVRGKTFRVGDTLEFQYGSIHALSVVDKPGFDSCDSSGASQSFSDGDTKIDLTTVGTMHFICPIPGHCPNGMKLVVPVLAAASTPSTPSPPPSPKSPPPLPRSPPPSTPSPPPSTPSPPPSPKSPPPLPKSPPPSTPSPPPSKTPSPPHSKTPSPPPSTPSPPPSSPSSHKPKTPPPSASPRADVKPYSESSTPSPSPSSPTPSPIASSQNAASKRVMSYGVIGMTVVLMYVLMS